MKNISHFYNWISWGFISVCHFYLFCSQVFNMSLVIFHYLYVISSSVILEIWSNLFFWRSVVSRKSVSFNNNNGLPWVIHLIIVIFVNIKRKYLLYYVFFMFWSSSIKVIVYFFIFSNYFMVLIKVWCFSVNKY